MTMSLLLYKPKAALLVADDRSPIVGGGPALRVLRILGSFPGQIAHSPCDDGDYRQLPKPKVASSSLVVRFQRFPAIEQFLVTKRYEVRGANVAGNCPAILSAPFTRGKPKVPTQKWRSPSRSACSAPPPGKRSPASSGPLSKCPSSSAWSTCRSGPGRRYVPTTPEATTASSATSPPRGPDRWPPSSSSASRTPDAPR